MEHYIILSRKILRVILLANRAQKTNAFSPLLNRELFSCRRLNPQGMLKTLRVSIVDFLKDLCVYVVRFRLIPYVK